MTEEIRVLIADDQRVVREGLATLLGLLPGVTVVGAVGDGEQAVSNALELAPDVVLMDLRMPRCDGVEATRRLLASNPEAKVLVLTTYADDRSVVEALRAGAQGYLTKDAGAEDIHRSLQQVIRGQTAIDPAVQHHLVQAVAGRSPVAPAPGLPDGLTPREAEVLRLMAEGKSNTEIASQLLISEATVKSHINHIFAKIGVSDRARAVSYAYQRGLTAPPDHAAD